MSLFKTGCIDKIYSVSALIGGPGCNGNCAFCAGRYLRPEAKESLLYWKNYEAAIKLCSKYGGWSLSLTSSGEPLLYPASVTKALEIYDKCAKEGCALPNVNIFTNGILLGDSKFCDEWIPKWRALGLTNFAISVHSVDLGKQAEAYGIDWYPHFIKIRENVIKHGVGVRATLLLRKGEVDNAEKYKDAVDMLAIMGYDNITSWPVGNPDGTSNEFTPDWKGMASIRYWLWRNTIKCHGHAWGGGVFDYNGTMLRLTDYVTPHDPKANFVRQLVVFQDSEVCYSWIRKGARCMK